jgi:hypothetical protein
MTALARPAPLRVVRGRAKKGEQAIQGQLTHVADCARISCDHRHDPGLASLAGNGGCTVGAAGTAADRAKWPDVIAPAHLGGDRQNDAQFPR